MCDTLLCSSCSVFVIELSWTQRMDCSSVVLGLKLPSCVCLTHCGSRKIRVPGRYTSIRVSGSCIWLLHIGEDQTVYTVYMVMTTLIPQLFDAIEYTSWMYRRVSVEDQFSFVILCVFVWMQVIVDDDARVVEMLYHWSKWWCTWFSSDSINVLSVICLHYCRLWCA